MYNVQLWQWNNSKHHVKLPKNFTNAYGILFAQCKNTANFTIEKSKNFSAIENQLVEKFNSVTLERPLFSGDCVLIIGTVSVLVLIVSNREGELYFERTDKLEISKNVKERLRNFEIRVGCSLLEYISNYKNSVVEVADKIGISVAQCKSLLIFYNCYTEACANGKIKKQLWGRTSIKNIQPIEMYYESSTGW